MRSKASALNNTLTENAATNKVSPKRVARSEIDLAVNNSNLPERHLSRDFFRSQFLDQNFCKGFRPKLTSPKNNGQSLTTINKTVIISLLALQLNKL